jgi:hypothetical protein
MRLRLLTIKEAKDLGRAASVAGGWVALESYDMIPYTEQFLALLPDDWPYGKDLSKDMTGKYLAVYAKYLEKPDMCKRHADIQTHVQV